MTALLIAVDGGTFVMQIPEPQLIIRIPINIPLSARLEAAESSEAQLLIKTFVRVPHNNADDEPIIGNLYLYEEDMATHMIGKIFKFL
jgi:hypothetical protein